MVSLFHTEIKHIIDFFVQQHGLIVEYFNGTNFNCIPVFDSNNIHLLKNNGDTFNIAIFLNIDKLNLFFPNIIDVVLINCRANFLIGLCNLYAYKSTCFLTLTSSKTIL